MMVVGVRKMARVSATFVPVAGMRDELLLSVFPLRRAGLLLFASSHRGTGVSPLSGCHPSSEHSQGRRCWLRHEAALFPCRGS